jgi:DNA-binding MarR family transcriptional regulator
MRNQLKRVWISVGLARSPGRGHLTEMAGKTNKAEKTYSNAAMAIAEQVACTNTALRRASRRLGQLYDEALAPIGLRGTQLSLLSQIDAMTGPSKPGGKLGPTLQDLAAELALRVSGITHAMTPLIRDGLVELRQDPEDARTKHAALTSEGRAKLAKAVEYWAIANQHVERVMGSLTTAKLRELADQISVKAFDLSTEMGHIAGRRSKN